MKYTRKLVFIVLLLVLGPAGGKLLLWLGDEYGMHLVFWSILTAMAVALFIVLRAVYIQVQKEKRHE